MLLRKAYLLTLLALAIPAIKTQARANGSNSILPNLNVFMPLVPLIPTSAVPFTNIITGPLTLSELPVPNLARQRDLLSRIAEGSQSFALEMFVKFSDVVTKARRDFVISPFAIWSLLLPLSEGAVGNTLTELRTTMRLKEEQKILRDAFRTVKSYLNLDTPTVKVGSIQALFTDVNMPVNREFQDIIEREYGADLIPINFHDPAGAADIANEEVRNATRGLIQYVLQPQDFKDANLLLMSSLFFKGQWKSPFNASLTRNEPFYDEDGIHIGNVDMMMQIGNFDFTGMNDLEGHVLELPYGKEQRLAMLIILPKRGVSLTKVAHNLQQIGIAPILQKLSSDSVGYEDDDVEVYLPKFTESSDFSMNVILHEMGIKDLFDPNYANLSKMSANLFVSNIIHSTKIVVDEEGTTAASVTAAVLANKATPPKFYLNRPFIYLIVEKKTNTLLFCGHIMNPNRK